MAKKKVLRKKFEVEWETVCSGSFSVWASDEGELLAAINKHGAGLLDEFSDSENIDSFFSIEPTSEKDTKPSLIVSSGESLIVSLDHYSKYAKISPTDDPEELAFKDRSAADQQRILEEQGQQRLI